MAIAFLSTLAVQIGSAYFNNFRSKKHAQEMARKQQAYEDKVARDGIENARAEFAELCAFQRDMEVEMQKDRLNLIRSNHENSLIQAAYETSLGSWPLMVPPYVIKNDTILSNGQSSEKAIPLNCILTTSTDSKFNKAVFYKIEEALACFCSKYWNVSANKSIRFFQESWRDNFKDVGVKHKDLYAHLSDVPILVISPVIKNGKLIFRFYWWGLSIDPADAHIDDVANELDPEVNITISSSQNYSEEEIESIISVCIPKLETFISFFADLYYWKFYNTVPTLPTLIESEVIHVNSSNKNAYYQALQKVFHDSLLHGHPSFDLEKSWMAFSPALTDIDESTILLANYINAMPDSRIEKTKGLISTISTSQHLSKKASSALEIISTRIAEISTNKKQEKITWKIERKNHLTILDVFHVCEDALPALPECDTFNIITRGSKFAIIAFFTKNGEVVSWDNLGIWVFLSPEFIAPENLFVNDRFSCNVNSLRLFNQVICKNMNKEDIFAIIDSQYDQIKKELRPAASKIEDVFSDFVKRIKETVAQEQSAKEVESFNRKELKYEDIVNWLRKAKAMMGNTPFNGAFLTKDKGGFFDKYPSRMYVCLTMNRQPLTDANHPKVVFSYEITDDTLDDMFGRNNGVQINFK